MRRLVQVVMFVAVAVYAVSLFWTGWIDRLSPGGQAVAYGLLGVLVLFDVALHASPRLNAWFTRLFSPRA